MGKPVDAICVNDLLVSAALSTGSHWPKGEAVEQPLSISLKIFYDTSLTGLTDNLSYSLDYSRLAKTIRSHLNGRSFQSLQDLSKRVSDILDTILSSQSVDIEAHIRVVQLSPPLHLKSVAIEYDANFSANGTAWKGSDMRFILEDLRCSSIIGVNLVERLEAQEVVTTVHIETNSFRINNGEKSIVLRDLSRVLYHAISESKFQTLEALASFISVQTLSFLRASHPLAVVEVHAAKPNAIVFASSSQVRVRRAFSDYPKEFGTPSHLHSSRHRAAIALGSNLGDSCQNIEHALRLLESGELDDLLPNADQGGSSEAVVDIVETSFLYSTEPMYVTDQPSFVNGACLVETVLSPSALLRLLKGIEKRVGRVPSVRNGPRAVDLDIIFYDDLVIDTRDDKDDVDHMDGTLVLPHPRLQEREFVLRPLNDMIPDFVHPVLNQTVERLLIKVSKASAPMKKIIPFPCGGSISAGLVPRTSWAMECSGHHVMATLNVTPDSFSDGATHDKLSTALTYVSNSVSSGASFVDIGGYSTRPGAAFVPVEEEISRVVPVIRAIRDGTALRSMGYDDVMIDKLATVLISVDTFRPEVAEAAIHAGANCINDVYAFSGPDPPPLGGKDIQEVAERKASYMKGMKAIARKYSVPVVLMHSRGDAGQNKDYSAYNASPCPVLEGVRVELGRKVDAIVKGKGGLRRWSVIVDPGIGFSKTLEGNLEVLKRAKEVVADTLIGVATTSIESPNLPCRNPLRGFHQLIGVSRKSFLGAVLEGPPGGRKTEAKERTFATAAAVTCAVQQGALIIRVHDVEEMVDVVKVAALLCP